MNEHSNGGSPAELALLWRDRGGGGNRRRQGQFGTLRRQAIRVLGWIKARWVRVFG